MIHFSSSCRKDFQSLDNAYRIIVKQHTDMIEQLRMEQQTVAALRKSFEAEQQLRECAEEMRMKDQQQLIWYEKELNSIRNELKHSRLEASEFYEECEMLRAKVLAFEALQIGEPQITHYEGKQYRKKKKSEERELQG